MIYSLFITFPCIKLNIKMHKKATILISVSLTPLKCLLYHLTLKIPFGYTIFLSNLWFYHTTYFAVNIENKKVFCCMRFINVTQIFFVKYHATWICSESMFWVKHCFVFSNCLANCLTPLRREALWMSPQDSSSPTCLKWFLVWGFFFAGWGMTYGNTLHYSFSSEPKKPLYLMLTKLIAIYSLCPGSFILFITLIKLIILIFGCQQASMISHVRTTHPRAVKIPGFCLYDPIMIP